MNRWLGPRDLDHVAANERVAHTTTEKLLLVDAGSNGIDAASPDLLDLSNEHVGRNHWVARGINMLGTTLLTAPSTSGAVPCP